MIRRTGCRVGAASTPARLKSWEAVNFTLPNSSMTAHGTLAVSGGDLELGRQSGNHFYWGQIGGDGGNVIANGGLNISGAGAETCRAFRWLRNQRHNQQWCGRWSGTGDIAIGAVGVSAVGREPGYPVRCRASTMAHSSIGRTGQIGRSDRRSTRGLLLNNSGSSNVTQGVLSFTGGGTHTGSFCGGANG